MTSKKPPKKAAAKKKPAKKSTAKKPAPKRAADKPMPPLEAPKHGSGLLYRGGVPGNRGGGRPPSLVRQTARLAFDERVAMLAEIADGIGRLRLVGVCEKCGHESPAALSPDEIRSAVPGVSDRIAAIDKLGKYGLGAAKGLDDQEFEAIVLDLGESVQQRLRARFANDVAAPLLEQILDDWKRIIVARRAVRRD